MSFLRSMSACSSLLAICSKEVWRSHARQTDRGSWVMARAVRRCVLSEESAGVRGVASLCRSPTDRLCRVNSSCRSVISTSNKKRGRLSMPSPCPAYAIASLGPCPRIKKWRRRWDSNPRDLAAQTLSKRPPSTTRPLLRSTAGIISQIV